MGKILVTGAAGFIGSHVTRLLTEEQNEDVRAVLAPRESPVNLSGLDVEIVHGDIRDRDAMDRYMKGCDRMYHLAAIYKIWVPDINVIYDVNVNGTEVLMEAALRHDLEKVVFTSSIAGIGIAQGKALSDETTPFNQWDRGNAYVLSKYISQVLVENMARNRDLPAVIVNPSFPFGARDRAPTPTGQIILQVARGSFPAYMDGGINVVDVEDVARGHLLAEKKGRVGECYLLTATNINTRDFMRTVAELSGSRPPMFGVPTPVALAAGYLSEFVADHITRRTPMLTGRGIAYATQYLYFDNKKAREELGLAFRPLRESLEQSLGWFRENGFLRNN